MTTYKRNNNNCNIVVRSLVPVAMVTALFFAWGFVTVFVDMLIPRLRSLFELSYSRVMLIQFGFFLAYLVVSVPASIAVRRVGYQFGIVIGLLVMATGALLFLPAGRLRVFELFIVALFVLASGITILQVAANPLMVLLGPAETGASRLTLAQAFNSLGTTLAPMAGAVLLYSSDLLDPSQVSQLPPDQLQAYRDSSAQSVESPFLAIAAFLVVLAALFAISRLRAFTDANSDRGHADQSSDYESAISSGPLVFGIMAIFLYVGAEVSIGSFLVNYFVQTEVAGLGARDAAGLVTFYWGSAMVGRFVGSLAMRFSNVRLVLSGASLMAFMLVAITILVGGPLSVWSILAVGFFNSIHFPTIFSLAIDRLGPHTPRGSGYLCMAIFGGAIVPVLTGLLADATTIRFAFFLPALCYVYLLWYAWIGSRHRR